MHSQYTLRMGASTLALRAKQRPRSVSRGWREPVAFGARVKLLPLAKRTSRLVEIQSLAASPTCLSFQAKRGFTARFACLRVHLGFECTP